MIKNMRMIVLEHWASGSAVVILLIMVAACAVNPVTGKKEFSLLSEQDEIAMGQQHYPVMTQISGGEFTHSGLDAYVNEVAMKLVAVSHRPDLPFEFNVVNSSEVNAYALPAGKISITRGLISRMNNEAQLAAVLGHEIGHVTARHVSEAISRQMLAQVAVAGLSIYLQQQEVKNAGYYSLAGLYASQLLMLKFSRDNERQSDDVGLGYMAAAGYDPQGMVELLEILHSAHQREPSKLEAFFQTHPLTAARIEDTRTRIASLTPPPGGTMGTAPFVQRTAILSEVEEAYSVYDQAEALMAEGKIKPAIQSYRRAIALRPDQAIFHSDLAAAHFRLKQYGATRKALDRALELYPDLFQSRFYSGLHYSAVKDWNRSLGEFNHSNGLIPDHPGVRYHQAFCHENLRHRDRAVTLYREVLSLDTSGEYAPQADKRLKALGAAP